MQGLGFRVCGDERVREGLGFRVKGLGFGEGLDLVQMRVCVEDSELAGRVDFALVGQLRVHAVQEEAQRPLLIGGLHYDVPRYSPDRKVSAVDAAVAPRLGKEVFRKSVRAQRSGNLFGVGHFRIAA